MNRREYFAGAATAFASLLAGCGSRDEPGELTNGSDRSPNKTSTGDDSRGGTYEIEFDRVVNAVDGLGMDSDGNEPIDSALNRAYQEGTLVRFPPGDYVVSETRVIDGNVSRFGIQGTGDDRGDVTFHFPNAGNGYWFIHQNGGHNVLLDNFTIDTDQTHVAIRCRTHGESLIRDVEWEGFLPEKTTSLGQLLDPGCLSVDGVNTVKRVVMGRDGAHVSGHYTRTGTHSMTGIRFYGTSTRSGVMGHAGETVLEDVEIHQIGSNGVRHTHGDGVVTIEGGLFKNCHLASLRIHNGDHPSKDSTVTDATIVIDHEDAETIGTGEWSKHGTNGILLDSTGHGYSQPTYENCEIICRSILSNGGWGLIRETNTGRSNPGGAVFKNCRIVNRTELQTVQIDARKPGAEPPDNITFDNVEIYLLDESHPHRSVVTIEDNWDGSIITGSTIYAPRGAVDGVLVRNCEDVVIEDTTIFVSRFPIVELGAKVVTRNLSYEKPEGISL